MEDFSTILWVVIIVGAMIFNTVTKARKARGKDGNGHPQHGEAWPSIPWDNDGDEDPQKAPTAEIPSREPLPHRSDAAGQPTQEYIPPRKEVARPDSEVHPRQEPTMNRPVFSDFPHELPNRKEISPQAYETGHKGAKITIPGFPAEVSAPGKTIGKPAEKPSGKQSNSTKSGSFDAQGRSLIPEESEAAEIAEEFDLRRAVIYSEILKPKFEEL